MTYPKPETPLPWTTEHDAYIRPQDEAYMLHAANAFPNLVAALELIIEEDWDAERIAKHALAIARGESKE